MPALVWSLPRPPQAAEDYLLQLLEHSSPFLSTDIGVHRAVSRSVLPFNYILTEAPPEIKT